jgi:hypothetical protein
MWNYLCIRTYILPVARFCVCLLFFISYDKKKLVNVRLFQVHLSDLHLPHSSSYKGNIEVTYFEGVLMYVICGFMLNLYEPYVLYIGQAHRYPPNTPFYIFFQQIYVLNFLNMLHTLHFFLFKMPFIS